MPRDITQLFGRLVKASGLPRITAHQLRHGHATYLARTTRNPRLVAERLGHHDPGFTMAVYASVLLGDQAKAAADVAAAVDGTR